MAMTAKLNGKKLTVEIDINNPPTPSATGKTLVVASSHGNQASEVQVNGKPLYIGLNAYVRKD